jgi:hypothetical protein
VARTQLLDLLYALQEFTRPAHASVPSANAQLRAATALQSLRDAYYDLSDAGGMHLELPSPTAHDCVNSSSRLSASVEAILAGELVTRSLYTPVPLVDEPVAMHASVQRGGNTSTLCLGVRTRPQLWGHSPVGCPTCCGLW